MAANKTLTDPAPTLLTGLMAGLEKMLNEVLQQDTISSAKLSKLGGRWLQVSVTPLPQPIYLQVNFPLRLAADIAGQPDTVVTGSPWVLLNYWQHGRKVPELSISGDQLLASQLAQISSELDIDWEGKLAELIGNLPAHFIANQLRDAQLWLRYVQQHFFKDAEEYLHHESRVAPAQEEIQVWQEEIATLVSDVDALASRLLQLEAGSQQTGAAAQADRANSGTGANSDYANRPGTTVSHSDDRNKSAGNSSHCDDSNNHCDSSNNNHSGKKEA